jgi:beta-carotene ketolase (CrtW type)
MTLRRQMAVGLLLAFLIIGGWLSMHIWGVFFHRWNAVDVVRAPLVVLLQAWLGAGMFIVAHDAIHGSLTPGHPRLNAVVGQIAVGLYAGFSYRKLAASHQLHHDAPGTATDPDFHPTRPAEFTAWLARFFLHHFGWREFGLVTVVLGAYLIVGAPTTNLIVFWGLPAILSALQLFTFGTYLPHRHAAEGFADEHRARSLDYPWLLSLLTSFHFGRHHEHHLSPGTPWWRLPQVRR